MIDTKPNDFLLTEISFDKDQIGRAIFENGTVVSFSVEWDGLNDSYTFTYREVPHSFSVKRDLGEVLTHADIVSL